MKYICIECRNTFKEKGEHAFKICPRCGGDSWWEGSSKFVGTFTDQANSKAPPKGSPEYYKGRWFRRNEKEWHEDIRSRVASPDGKQVRRIGRNN